MDTPHSLFPERALDTWIDRSLEVEALGNGLLHFTFTYRGSSCMNGGTEFEVELHLHLQTDRSDPEVGAAWIHLPESQIEAVDELCAAAGDAQALIGRLAVPETGVPLGKLLAESERGNPAGCLCTDAMAAHKWSMVLHTVRRYLDTRRTRLLDGEASAS